MQTETIERTIDRGDEYDQTKRHERLALLSQPIPSSKPMSPSILEQKILMLEKDNRRLESERDRITAENLVLKQRVRGFERMSESLAASLDKTRADVDLMLRGKTITVGPEPLPKAA